jgi:signal transduction histidine kinase
MHRRLSQPPPIAPWVQVDLGASHPIDWVALIPAQVDWQLMERPSHGFPLRFRIDVSEDQGFRTFQPLLVCDEEDFPDPGIAPVSARTLGKRGRYVRLTVTKMARENGQYFYALAEFMVLSGRRNLANGAAIQSSDQARFPPRWSLGNLVDGCSPLGPPIERDLLPYDGLYSGPDPSGSAPWMEVDLGRVVPVEEIRLHPIHARLGADIPGFSFPRRMKVELSVDESFANAVDVAEGWGKEGVNPGNNAVTLQGRGVEARYVRVTQLDSPESKAGRFGLSELELYSEGVNVARGAVVRAIPDPAPMSRNWPLSQLVDGYASYGRLMELPEWLEKWSRRAHLQREMRVEMDRIQSLKQKVRRRLWGWGAWFLVLGLAVGVGVVLRFRARSRRRREAEILRLRRQFAHDLHDEIGSNLAAISVISEMARGHDETGSEAQVEHWEEIQRIARESNEALREVLWVSGVREETGEDLVEQLQKAARRILVGCELRWLVREPIVSAHWSLEGRRQVFLFFKETLTNVVRHSMATEVELLLEVVGGRLRLRVRDNGRGFAVGQSGGTGLRSLEERGRALGGTCRIESHEGKGTSVELEIPIPTASGG